MGGVTILDGGALSAAVATVLGTTADAITTSRAGLWTPAQGFSFNGATWDRTRGNVDSAALITAVAATSTQTAGDQTNYNGRGLIVVLDATAVVGVGSFTLAIQGKDAASGKYFTLLTGAAVTTVSTNVYTVYPGAPATANVSANAPLPRTWRVVATYNSGTSLTFTVGASVIV